MFLSTGVCGLLCYMLCLLYSLGVCVNGGAHKHRHTRKHRQGRVRLILGYACSCSLLIDTSDRQQQRCSTLRLDAAEMLSYLCVRCVCVYLFCGCRHRLFVRCVKVNSCINNLSAGANRPFRSRSLSLCLAFSSSMFLINAQTHTHSQTHRAQIIQEYFPVCSIPRLWIKLIAKPIEIRRSPTATSADASAATANSQNSKCSAATASLPTTMSYSQGMYIQM